MRISIPLTANEEKRLPYPGAVLQLVDLGAVSTVTLAMLWQDASDRENVGAVPRRFKVGPGRRFSGFALLATVNTTIDILVADSDAGLATTTEVSVDALQLPLPVETRNEDDLAADPTNPAAVAVTDAGVMILAADTTARRVVIHNSGTNTLAISRGAAAAAYANTPIRLATGETYIEERFAGANHDYYGRCDTGGTATAVIEVWK